MSSKGSKTLRTKLCDMLDIEYPIILAGMGGVAGPTLTAAVSNAGGLGVLGAAGLSADQLRDWIRKTKELTDKPFGVDLLLPKIDLPPMSGKLSISELRAFLPAEDLAFVDKLKKEIGIPDVEIPEYDVWSDFLSGGKTLIDVIMEERVAVFASGLGNPESVVPRAHAQGMKVIGLVGNVKNARRVAEAGADIIVAQGHEAGGHTGRIGTMALVPQVIDAVHPLPVVAAGGVGDGRGLVASLAMGAWGVWVGSAFLLAHESSIDAPKDWITNLGVDTYALEPWEIENWKEGIIAATEEDTRVTRIYTGKTARFLSNKFIEAWDKAGGKALPMPLQTLLICEAELGLRKARMTEYMAWFAGQIVGMLKERKSAKQIVDDMVEEAIVILKEKLPAEVKAED
ncbi:MAG: nitronate monooxygenase [Dehalococcoidia bacterium]|nr:MAG: nitronate monooxygenase [Dehalococcoidia bacterium]